MSTSEGEKLPRFEGGLVDDREKLKTRARPVLNERAQGGGEVVALRYWKIEKGGFPEFLKASEEGVWPFFEKIGSRIVGMWKVADVQVPGKEPEDEGDKDYDEVYLMTRYRSLEHWQATRDPIGLGGNGPDWDACAEALEVRRKLTRETHVTFMEGRTSANPPYFLPGTKQT